jgi:GNAT superfamily N-acetyltransferase
MNVEFRKAIIPDEVGPLYKFDHIAFASFPGDPFEAEDWEQYESYWMIVDGKIVGRSAFLHNVDYDEEPRTGCLWIASIGILPEVQGQGLGSKLKEWQIKYATQHGFEIIVTNMRQSNSRILGLNEKFGFKIREFVTGYYDDPDEVAIVMELKIAPEVNAATLREFLVIDGVQVI